ncbi:hypothetical protein ACFL3S_11870 [Gemmatimonadota bacterium]
MPDPNGTAPATTWLPIRDLSYSLPGVPTPAALAAGSRAITETMSIDDDACSEPVLNLVLVPSALPPELAEVLRSAQSTPQSVAVEIAVCRGDGAVVATFDPGKLVHIKFTETRGGTELGFTFSELTIEPPK